MNLPNNYRSASLLSYSTVLAECSERIEVAMAEEVRFELTEPVKVQRFSRPPHSTTLPPLRNNLS
jgi:hypothetical protein